MVKVYEETIAGCENTTTESILEAIKTAKAGLRPGIGTRSKLLFTNPRNKEKVGAIVKTVTEAPKDLFVPFPWRVITSEFLPEKVKKKSGRIIWHDTRFVTYSSGPSPGSGLSDEEYLSMCIYFGWAEEEIIEMMGWWEMDEPQFSNFMNMAQGMSKKIQEDVNKKIALKIFQDEGSLLSPARHHGLLTTFA